MTEQELFEEACPVPEGVSFDNGMYSEPGKASAVALHHTILYRGFQLGRAQDAEVRKDSLRLNWCIRNNRFPSKTRTISTAYNAKTVWTCAVADGSYRVEAETACDVIDKAMIAAMSTGSDK